MTNIKDPFLSKLLTTMQLYTLFKDVTGKGERNFHELFAARLNVSLLGRTHHERRKLKRIVRVFCERFKILTEYRSEK